MSYAIIRNANYKKENLAGLYKHNERKNTNYSNKEINKNNSVKNYSLKQCNTTYTNALKILQKENNLKGRIIKTTNVVCEFIITSDKNFFDSIGEEETLKYFQTAYQFVANYQNLGERYILSAKVHMDESTPHMHLVFVPVVHAKDRNGRQIEKIACSEFWKGKNSYQNLQNDFHNYMRVAGFDLERGKSTNNKHLSMEQLKSISNYERIKEEIQKTPIKETNSNSLALVVAENKQLVKHCNRLREYCITSVNTFDKCKEYEDYITCLEKENANLKYENNKLRNYIEKIFEIARNLFDFPIDRFKRLVDNFIRNFER